MKPISQSDLFYLELLLFVFLVVMVRNRRVPPWAMLLVFVFAFELASTPAGYAVGWVINTLFYTLVG